MTLKIGLIGCGRWGRYILRDLKTIGCHVTVVDKSGDALVNALNAGADDCVDTLEALGPDMDGFVVATPTVCHLNVVSALISQRKPIFVEKPLTNDLAGAKRLWSGAVDNVFVMHKWRYHPGIETLRLIARDGEFGPVWGLFTRRVQWTSPQSDVDAISILAPHDLSIALHIFGSVPTPVGAFAVPQGPAGTGLTGELVDEATRARVIMEISIAHPFPKREIILGCRDAVICLSDEDYNTLTIRHWPEKSGDFPETKTLALTNKLPLFAELERFVDHVRGGPPPLSSLAEEMCILETITQLRAMAGLTDTVENNNYRGTHP